MTFRSGVDLVAVDTQVVDRDGQPLTGLTTGNFEVWINGQARKVVSADLIQYPLAAPRELVATLPNPASPNSPSDLPPVTGRVIVLAIDEVSFSIAAMPAAVQSAKRFLARLPAEDVVALYAYPFGSGRIDLTHYHNQVSAGLSRVQGYKQSSPGGVTMTPSEAIDIAANDESAFESVYDRECLVMCGNSCVDRDLLWLGCGPPQATAGFPSRPKPQAGSTCTRTVLAQAHDTAMYLEQVSANSFAGLRDLLRNLALIEGPKTVILLSAGVMASDRAGGRPDVSSMMANAGQLAAAADASLYALHMDGSFFDFNSASGFQQSVTECQGGISGGLVSNSRDGDLAAAGLERLAGVAGGAYFRVQAGGGDSFFDRVLRETSAYYVLGVQPEDVDRDGKTHFIRVKTVDVKNSTVRFRTQVAIPKTTAGQ